MSNTTPGVTEGTYRFTLSGACNGFSSSFNVSGSGSETELNFRRAGRSTAQVCPDERGDFDRTLKRLFFSASSVEITAGKLIIKGPRGRLGFEPN